MKKDLLQHKEKQKKLKWEEKQQYGCFKGQTKKIAHALNWECLRRGTQNHVIKAKYIVARINSTQQNSI